MNKEKGTHHSLYSGGHVVGGGGQIMSGQGVDDSVVGHVGGGSVGRHIGHETSVQGVGGGQVVGKLYEGMKGMRWEKGHLELIGVTVSIYTLYCGTYLCTVLNYYTVHSQQTYLLVPEINN